MEELSKSYKFKDLPPYIQHMVKYKAISVIPLEVGGKKPKNGVKWTQHRGLGKQYRLKLLKRKHGNFGVICGDPAHWGMGYLTILDIDDKKLYPIFKDIDTLHVKTASKGYHLYFWSQKEVQNKDQLGRMFNMNIELRGNPNFYTVLPPSSIQREDGSIGGHKVIREQGEFKSFMDVGDVEEYLKKVIEDAGHKANEIETSLASPKGLNDRSVYNAPLKLADRWEHSLQEKEIRKLVELLKPFYSKGYRQDMCLWLSGWMLKAEITYKSAVDVITQLARDDTEIQQRIAAVKNSYRGLEKKSLKGSSGICEIIKNYFGKKYENDTHEMKRKSKKCFNAIYSIVVHPLSFLGIQYTLKALKKKIEHVHITRVYDFLENRYMIVKDDPTWQHWIYNKQEGVYELYNDDQFLEFLINVLGKGIFTSNAAKTLKSMFGNVGRESSKYVAFNNCLLDLETLKPVEFTSEEFITFKIPYDWNPNAKGGIVESKLKEILIDTEGSNAGVVDKYVQYLQMSGYCIAENRNPRQKMFLIYGGPGTGKTQLIQLIAGLFPCGVSSVPLQRFQDQFGLLPLLNKRINTLYDISAGEINDPSIIKAVTGGDSMTIDRKYKEPVTYNDGLPVKTIGGGNELPRIIDVSRAIFERIITIELKNKFRGTKKEEKDIELYQKLLKEDEGISWFIHKAVSEYKKIRDNNKKFCLEKDTKAVEKEYMRVSDPYRYVALLLFEKSNDEHDFYTRKEVRQMLEDKVKEEGLDVPLTGQEYYSAIRRIGGEDMQKKILGYPERGFILLKVRDNSNDPADTRLQNHTIIEKIDVNMQSLWLENLSFSEKEILGKVVNYLQKFETTTMKSLMNDLDMERYGKKQIRKVLEGWKQKGHLTVNNMHYKK